MKKLNVTSFVKVCSGIALVVFSLAALMYTVKPSFAAPDDKANFDKYISAGENGKYALQYEIGQEASGSFFWHVFITNTETGNYKAYQWNRKDQVWEPLFANSVKFPGLP